MKKLAVVLLLLAGPAGAAVEGTWTAIGPEGGDVTTVAASSDGVVWAGTSRDGGLFRSADGGSTWKRIGGALEHLKVRLVAVDPIRSKIVYASTQSAGLFRSTDGGTTWAPSNQGLPSFGEQPAEVTSLVLDPLHPDRVFAVAGAGFYRSRNQGRTWKRLRDSYVVFALAPSDPRVLYVVDGRGDYRSTDGGLTWTPMNLGLYGGSDAFLLAVHPRSPETVWAALDTRFGGPALLRSGDGGQSWDAIWIHRKIRTLVIDPREPDTLWAGVDGGLLRILDGGSRVRFFPVSQGEGVQALVFDPSDQRRLFAGTGWNDRSTDGYPGRQGGVWRSSDRGKTWQRTVRGMIATDVRAVVVPAPGRIVAAVRGRGPMLGSGRGFDWIRGAHGIEGDIYDLLADPADPDRLWAATSNGVFRSEDGGRTWTWSSQGLTGSPLLPSLLTFKSLALDPAAPDGLWVAGWGGLFRSADGGGTWSRIDSLPDRAFESLAVDPRDGRRVWVTASGGGPTWPAVLRSEDGGSTWRETPVFSYAIGPVVVGPTGTAFASTLGEIVRSSDGGATWQEGDLGGVLSIAPDPADPDIVWAAGIFGLHRSRDGGATWEEATGGPALPVVLDLEWEAPGSLLLATRGGGLFRFIPND